MTERATRGTQASAVAARPAARHPVRDVALGSRRRIGIWILPLFVLVATLSAALAGGLAFLYYGQQVEALEGTTASARADLDGAVERVSTVASEATAAIDAQVRGVEESLADGPPITAPAGSGIYAVAADHPGGEVRVGSAFTLFSDTRETYLATSYRVIASGGGTAVPTARLSVPGQGAVEVRVHNFDAALDVAVLVAPGGPLPLLPWRPAEEPLAAGAPAFLAAVAGEDTPVALGGTVAGVGPRAIVTDLPVNAFVSGGPLTDAAGRVVAVAATGYEPFGALGGDLTYAVPVRLLCSRLLQCTPQDLGPEGLGPGEGTGTLPAEDAVPAGASAPSGGAAGTDDGAGSAPDGPEDGTAEGTDGSPADGTTGDGATGGARVPGPAPDATQDDAAPAPLLPAPPAADEPPDAPGQAPPLPAPVPTESAPPLVPPP